jgi:NADH:ubiquinone oxidoreductase subunit E
MKRDPGEVHMLTVVVCVGSSCYVRGSERLAETFERWIRERNLQGRVELTGAFCMEQCSMGVSVRVGDTVFRCVDAADAELFFEQQVMPRMAAVA